MGSRQRNPAGMYSGGVSLQKVDSCPAASYKGSFLLGLILSIFIPAGAGL